MGKKILQNAELKSSKFDLKTFSFFVFNGLNYFYYSHKKQVTAQLFIFCYAVEQPNNQSHNEYSKM